MPNIAHYIYYVLYIICKIFYCKDVFYIKYMKHLLSVIFKPHNRGYSYILNHSQVLLTLGAAFLMSYLLCPRKEFEEPKKLRKLT